MVADIGEKAECPYCGVQVPLKVVRKRRGFLRPIVWETEEEQVSYSVECPFCKRKYILFMFNNYKPLLRMLRFNIQTLEWIKRYNVDLRSIESRIVGVTEPMTPVYKKFAERIKERIRRLGGQEYRFIQFIEIIFEQKYGSEIYRGVLAGRHLASDVDNIISIEQSYWLNTPPL